MAVTDPYADPATYRAVVGKSDPGEDGEISRDLLAVSRVIDRKLGQHFTRDDADVARVYRAAGRQQVGYVPVDWADSENPWRYGGYSRLLHIDALSATPTSIKIDEDDDGSFADETALAATDYELWPQNADKGPEPRPWTAIYIPNYSSKSGFKARVRVEVLGRWGWPAVPEAIVRATCHLTGILRLESPRATTRVNELGEAVSTSRAAREILDELTALYPKVVGGLI